MDIINKMISFYKKAVFENYYNFNGRAALAEYWWFFLANFIISFLIGIVDGILGITLLGLIYSLAVLLPSLGAAVRRMHDIGKSGWWILAPFYNIWLLIQNGDEGNNAFGEPVKK